MLEKMLAGAGAAFVSYADITVVTSGSLSGNAAITFSPALAQNDVVFLIIGDNATDYTIPAGYVQITGDTITTIYKFSCYYKVMGAVPDTGIDLNDGNDSSGGTYYALRNVQTNSPVIEVNYTVGTSSATNLTPPALPAPAKSMFLVAGFTANGASAVLTAAPSGYTGFLTRDVSGGSDTYVGSAYKILTTTGTETPGAFTLTNSATAYAAVSIVVRPFSNTFVVRAPAYVSTSTATATGTTVSVNMPASTVEGNLMVAVCTAQGSVTWTGDTGWTEPADQGTSPSLRIAYKVAAAGEAGPYTFTTSASTTKEVSILTYEFGAYDAIAGSFSTGTDPLVLASASASLQQSLLIACGARNASNVTLGTPTGMTARLTNNNATAPSYIVCEQPAPKGPSGTRSMGTGSTTSVSGIMFTIKPTRSL